MQIKSHETPQVNHFSTQCGHHTQLGTRWQMTLILKSSARLGCTYRSRCTFPIGTITIIFIWLMQHEELTGAYGPPKCYKLVSMKINGRLYDHYTQGNFSKKCFMQPISEDFPHSEFRYFLPSPPLFHFFSYLRTWIGKSNMYWTFESFSAAVWQNCGSRWHLVSYGWIVATRKVLIRWGSFA